jgi:ParB family chromosome partitioning protein
VRRIGSSAAGDRYEIIAGERRFRAARQAGLTEVPVRGAATCPTEAALAMALIENIQREASTRWRKPRALARLISEFGMTQETAGRAVSNT